VLKASALLPGAEQEKGSALLPGAEQEKGSALSGQRGREGALLPPTCTPLLCPHFWCAAVQLSAVQCTPVQCSKVQWCAPVAALGSGFSAGLGL